MDFREIYETCYPLVYAYLMKQCSDAHLAEELTQETFERALKSIDRFKGECRLETWLCQIARNAFYSECRRRSRLSSLPDDSLPGQSPDPADRLMTSEGAMEVLRAAHRLDETQKEVFLLRACGEQDFASIGSLFGKNAAWARVTYHRAKLSIQKNISDKEGL